MAKSDSAKKKMVLKFLLSQPFISLSTATPTGEPHDSVMLFAVDDDFTISCATHEESYKAQLMAANMVVAGSTFEIGNAYVQFHGTATRIKSQAKILKVLDQLAKKADQANNFAPPIYKFPGENFVMFSIKPNWLRYMSLAENLITEKRPNMFDVISKKSRTLKTTKF